LKKYKCYIFSIIKNEKLEIDQNNYLIYQFKKYLNILQEIKEAANKRLKKLIKAALKKESYYNYELPLVELWEVVA